MAKYASIRLLTSTKPFALAVAPDKTILATRGIPCKRGIIYTLSDTEILVDYSLIEFL